MTIVILQCYEDQGFQNKENHVELKASSCFLNNMHLGSTVSFGLGVLIPGFFGRGNPFLVLFCCVALRRLVKVF